jgi:hypothetical protein
MGSSRYPPTNKVLAKCGNEVYVAPSRSTKSVLAIRLGPQSIITLVARLGIDRRLGHLRPAIK